MRRVWQVWGHLPLRDISRALQKELEIGSERARSEGASAD